MGFTTPRRLTALLMVAALVAPGCGSSGDDVETNLDVVGRITPDGVTLDDVAVAGTTAVVVAQRAVPHDSCAPSSVITFDVKDARKPKLASTVVLAGGVTAADVDALEVDSASFRGRLAVVALEQNPASNCDGAEPGLSLYDVTKAGRPTLLSESCEGCDGGYRSLSVAARDDGRVLIAAVESRSGKVRILDVTDPASPGSLSTWTHSSARSVSFYGRGDRMLVATGDAGVFDLDLTDMASPTEAASWNEADDPPAYATALLLADRTVVIVCEQDLSGRGGGVRVLQLDSGETQPRLRHPQGVGVPGRTVTSGEQAFVAWHSDGVRVYDVAGGGTTKVVAQFVPAQPADVVGVALLPNHVVVTDTNAGLYVLERPEEGSGGSWREKGLLALAAFGMAILAALVVVPRVGMALAMTGVRVPRTVPVRARRAGR